MSFIRNLIYKFGWDTRCRNVDVARILRPFINSETTVLDAGCGEYGLSTFLAAKSVVGVDILRTDVKKDGFTFIRGSIISLPFAERSFPVTASVDVLEHLPQTIRPAAIKELVKIAQETIIVTFPSGKTAREIDEGFNQKLTETGRPIPEWLAEHLENQYPDADAVASEIKAEAAHLGRHVRTSTFYSENLAIAKYLRWSAARSRYLYILGNLATGFLLPVLPGATKDNSYRAIVLAEFV